jgi:hypothetical protein
MEELAFEDSDLQTEIEMKMEEYLAFESRFEATARTMESLEAAIAEFNKNDTLSVESKTNLRLSLESQGSELSLEGFEVLDDELSLEKLTGFWNRMKQVFVSDWHNLVDTFGSLIKGWGKRMKNHRKINSELRSEWAKKKSSLLGNEHKTSLAGQQIYRPFVVNNQLSREPVKTMETDIEYTEYMLDQYPKDIQSYLMDLKTIVERGDYSDDSAFERSVLSKVVKLGHPRDVFKLDIVGYEGHPLMTNRGLEEKGGKDIAAAGSGKDYEILAEMANGVHVNEYFMTWDLLTEGYVFHDIFFSTRDVDDMLDLRDRYVDLVINLTSNRFFPVDKMAKEILKLRPKIKDDEALSEENVEAVKQINKLMGNFKDYILKPMRMEVQRVQLIVSASRTVVSRVIATAETK